MRTPRKKDHVEGTWQVALFVRSPDGDVFEFCSKKPLKKDDPPVTQARQAVAAILGIKTESIK